MSSRREVLALEKEHLIACSALSRMRLRRQVTRVRESLHLRQVAAAAATSPAGHRLVFGLAVLWIGLPRAARMLRVAARIVGYTRLVSSLISWSGKATGDRSRA